MNFTKTKKRILRFSNEWICLAILLLIGIVILKQLDLYDRLISIYYSCLPILMGVVIAFLFQPLIDRLQRRFSLRISVLIVYFGLFVISVLFVIILVPIVYEQIMDFLSVMPSWLVKIEHFFKTYHLSYDAITNFKDKYLEEGYVIVIDSLRHTISEGTKYGFAYITAFFISIDLPFWKRTLKKIMPRYHQFTTFYKTMSNIVYQYLIGTFLDLMFIVISVGLVLYWFDFPNAILYAIILALLNLFPYIGASIGLVLIAIVAVLSYDRFPFLAFFIVWCLQQIESNFIQPMIFNRTMNVRPLLTFVFIFISDALFGWIGVILSPIFAAIAQIAFRSYIHSKTSNTVGEWEDIWYDFDEAVKGEYEKYAT